MGKRILLSGILIFLMFLVVGCGGKQETAKPAENIPNPGQAQAKEDDKEGEVDKKSQLAPMIQEEKALPGAFMVSIDNHRPARPQSGLDKADRVYEVIAEGGITRYLAIYHSQQVDKIGPVRSARYYFTYIVKGHDLPFAHAGGSAQALSLINQLKIKDLDEIYNAGSFFFRDRERRAPYNLYTSTDLLVKGANAKKFKLLPLKPLEQGTAPGGEDFNLIDITYSNDPKYLYTVTYEWDGDRYKRYINGEPHKTLEGDVIFTENIIVLVARTRDVVTDQLRSEVDVIGKGDAVYFTGGKAYKGTWEKASAEKEFVFFYEGKSMKFQGEHAWINIIGNLNQLDYKNITM